MSFLLQESGFFLQQEDATKIVLDEVATSTLIPKRMFGWIGL